MADISRALGVDLITFADPAYWGQSDDDALKELARRAPETMWERLFAALEEAGVSRIEMTFGAFDHHSARRVFGSATGFAAELAARGMVVESGFWALRTDPRHPTLSLQAASFGDDLIGFLSEAGASTIVVGPPMRTYSPDRVPHPIGPRSMIALAELLGRIAFRAREAGLATAVHTEAHSVVATGRDVDLLMGLTDDLLVGLCPDSAHLTLAGGDPASIASRYAARIPIAHWKDAAGPVHPIPDDPSRVHAEHRPHFRALGDGVVDWTAWASVMANTPGAGVALVELDASPNPVRDLLAAREALENVGVILESAR